MNRCAILLVLCLALALTACVKPIQVRGGPGQQTVEIAQGDISDGLSPLIVGSETAREQLDDLDDLELTADVMEIGGSLVTVPGVLFLSSGRDDSSNFTLGIGLMVLGIATSYIGGYLRPNLGDYGEVLEAFNRDFPQTPYAAPQLGVYPDGSALDASE